MITIHTEQNNGTYRDFWVIFTGKPEHGNWSMSADYTVHAAHGHMERLIEHLRRASYYTLKQKTESGDDKMICIPHDNVLYFTVLPAATGKTNLKGS